MVSIRHLENGGGEVWRWSERKKQVEWLIKWSGLAEEKFLFTQESAFSLRFSLVFLQLESICVQTISSALEVIARTNQPLRSLVLSVHSLCLFLSLSGEAVY